MDSLSLFGDEFTTPAPSTPTAVPATRSKAPAEPKPARKTTKAETIAAAPPQPVAEAEPRRVRASTPPSPKHQPPPVGSRGRQNGAVHEHEVAAIDGKYAVAVCGARTRIMLWTVRRNAITKPCADCPQPRR